MGPAEVRPVEVDPVELGLAERCAAEVENFAKFPA